MSLTIEQLENINKNLLKQRDEAEVKIRLLVSLIDDDLWDNLDEVHKEYATEVMNKMKL